MNRLALAPVTINDAGPVELIEAAGEAGFASVDLRVLGAPGAAQVAPVAGDRKLIAAIAASCADSGVTVFAATGIWLTPEFDLDAYRPVLEVAARLGAEQFLAVGNDPDEARMTENLARLAGEAATLKLGVALELMPYTAVNSLAKASRMRGACAQPNLGLLIDALHLARSGGAPADVAALPPGSVSYVQLCDGPADPPAGLGLRAESLSARLYPGEGGLPLVELMGALPPDIVVDVETPVARHAGLPAAERARLALAATQRFLSLWRTQKSF